MVLDQRKIGCKMAGATLNPAEWNAMIKCMVKKFNDSTQAVDAFTALSALALYFGQQSEWIEKEMIPMYRSAVLQQISENK